MRYRFVFTITTALICLIALACGSPPQPPTQTQTQTQGSAPVAPAPFELTGYKVEWLNHKIPTNMEPGKEYHLAVTFKNAGDTKWPSKGTGGGVANRVDISYHWLAADGDKVVQFEGHRTALPQDVAPGESVTANDVLIVAPDPGSYRLQVTLVHEGVAWFEQQGARTLLVPVTVP